MMEIELLQQVSLIMWFTALGGRLGEAAALV